MAIAKKNVTTALIDKRNLGALIEQQYRDMDIPPMSDVTPESIRAMMAALGISPEENLFSRGIIATREGRG